MRNLLSAHFARLWKTRVFWVLLAILLAFAVWPIPREIEIISDPRNVPQERWCLMLFDHARLLGPVLAIFVSLFSGGEYDSGAVRNKLISGYTRTAVYLSSLFAVTAAAFLLCLSYTAVAAVGGWFVLGPMEDASPVLPHLLAVLFMCLSYCALFTLVGMNCPKTALSVLLCLGLTGTMFVACQFFISNVILFLSSIDADDKAAALYFLYYLLPMGQGDRLRNIQRGSPFDIPPLRLIPYSVLFTTAVTAAGLLLFRRKNIK